MHLQLSVMPAEHQALAAEAATPAVQISSKVECNTGNSCVARVSKSGLQRKPSSDNSSLLTRVVSQLCH